MMRDSFIFYKSFYESVKELKTTEQIKIYNAIFKFQFENEEVELKGVSKSVFNLIKPLLDANNQRYLNGKKGGAPKNNQNAKKKQPENNQELTEKQPKNKVMNNVLCIMNNENINKKENNKKKKKYFENEELNNLFLEFLELRKKIKAVNSERAINMLIKKLSNYDDDIKKRMIERSILNSWKDVYEIKQYKQEKLPDWFDKDIKQDDTKKQEMEDLLKDFK